MTTGSGSDNRIIPDGRQAITVRHLRRQTFSLITTGAGCMELRFLGKVMVEGGLFSAL